MKRLLLFFTVVAVLSSCSKSQDELKLEAFKNNLDNPSSFEFVEWGDVYSNIQLRHQNEIEKRIKQLEEKQNSCYSKIEENMLKDINYDNQKDKECADKYRDTANALSIMIRIPFCVNKNYCELIKRQAILERAKKYPSFRLELYDYIQNYADTAAFDTLNKVKKFKYRATNKFGALELMEGEISLD